jgi:hypothetical protein
VKEKDKAIFNDLAYGPLDGLCLPMPGSNKIMCYNVMPPGSEQGVHGDHESAREWHELGLSLDMFETSTAALGMEPLAIVAGGFDVGVTTVGCFKAGDCYLGSPGNGLPPMVVFGQDVLITSGDLVIGTAGNLVGAPGTVDIGTSGYSIIYDWGRLYSDYNTYVNVGWSPFTPKVINVLLYPP